MKKIKIAYWIVTILFAGFIFMSAIPDAMLTADAAKFMGHLGYPGYFTRYIGVAKMLGAIAIVIPGFPRIKEWAYAGLFFDLLGATYSNMMVDGGMGWLFMLVFLAFWLASYMLYNRLNRPTFPINAGSVK